MLNDQRFPGVVNDIVVEFGNSRYQGLMDRYIRGEDIPRDQLRHVWQDTTVVTPVWDIPIYEEFFGEVRRVNEKLASAQKIRVLLGDAPIDWSRVRGPDDVRRFGIAKERTTANVIQNEVLYLGPAPDNRPSRLPTSLCADPAYIAMRLRRLALAGGPVGSPRHNWAVQSSNALKQSCAGTAKPIQSVPFSEPPRQPSPPFPSLFRGGFSALIAGRGLALQSCRGTNVRHGTVRAFPKTIFISARANALCPKNVRTADVRAAAPAVPKDRAS